MIAILQKITSGLASLLLLGAATAAVVYGAPTAAQGGERQAGDPAMQPEPLILAVHPYLPPAEIITRFTPLADYLARAVGRPVVVRVGPRTGQHIEAVDRNSVDIAFIGPYAYVEEFYEEFGARSQRVLARLPEVPAHLFVTRSDLPVAQVKVLRQALLQLQTPPTASPSCARSAMV